VDLQLGRFGVWRAAQQTTPVLAESLEDLGYGTIWLGSSPGGDLAIVDELLGATTTLIVGTSIVNIWKDDAATIAADFARIEAAYPGRFVLGVGAGHPEATSEYASPYETLATYVDQLLAGGVPAGRIVLAALGPKVLGLARDAAAGAIPYLVTPGHTRMAREILGAGPLLAPEQKVVLDADPVAARKLARERAGFYLGLSNYTANLRRLGFTDTDLAGTGSDALIDALVAHGSLEDVVAQVGGHIEAGADHVCLQLLSDVEPGYAELARGLGL
jgi:probable F420-dependent oxidoreductase